MLPGTSGSPWTGQRAPGAQRQSCHESGRRRPSEEGGGPGRSPHSAAPVCEAPSQCVVSVQHVGLVSGAVREGKAGS